MGRGFGRDEGRRASRPAPREQTPLAVVAALLRRERHLRHDGQTADAVRRAGPVDVDALALQAHLAPAVVVPVERVPHAVVVH